VPVVQAVSSLASLVLGFYSYGFVAVFALSVLYFSVVQIIRVREGDYSFFIALSLPIL
jgi:hypothetical protein